MILNICCLVLSIGLLLASIRISQLEKDVEDLKLRIEVHRDVIKGNIDDISNLEIKAVSYNERLIILEERLKNLENEENR